MLAAVQSVEVGSTVNSEQYRFAVDYKRGASIAQSRFNDERILIRLVMSVAGEQANALAIPLNEQSIAVVLDFVNPFRAVGNFRPAARDARFKCYTHSA